MRSISYTDVVNLLNSLDIHSGEGLLVHSAIQYLGRPDGGVAMYYQALNHVLHLQEERAEQSGAKTNHSHNRGTLAVPTFNFAFAQGEPFDLHETPSTGMGALSEYVRQRPEALRTCHPMQSLAVIGHWAAELASRDTASAFDPGSAFERMLELDFRLLLLGADIQAVSIIHYSEQRAAVPYRYWKEFTGKVRKSAPVHQFDHSEGKEMSRANDYRNEVDLWETKTYRMYVRNLEINPRLDLSPIQSELDKRQLWSSIPVNYGQVATCKLVDFVIVADELLSADPYSLVLRGGRDDIQYA
jgi:aminoglycoside 3-N-acetyltransferase